MHTTTIRSWIMAVWMTAGASAVASVAGVSCTSRSQPASPGAPAALATASDGATAIPAATAWKKLAADFLVEFLRRNPVDATIIGEHKHDGAWPKLDEAADEDTRRFIDGVRAQLDAIALENLSPQDRIDAEILRNQLASWRFGVDELRDIENNPLVTTRLIGDGIDPLLNRGFAPHEERMRSLLARLRGVPAVLDVAKARLKNTPRVHTETAIEQNEGLIDLVSKGLGEHFGQEPELAKELQAAAVSATEALLRFQIFLKDELLARSHGDFRLGRARFEKKLRFVLDDQVDIDELAQRARTLLAETHAEMAEASAALWPELMKGKPVPDAKDAAARQKLIKTVLDAIAEDRPTNETIVDGATMVLADATTFVREHDLVRVPEEPCQVIEMPEYRRGVAVAYCDSSGPLEAKQETFYAIAPAPKAWPEKRALSFYREYNRAMLANMTVHEAMPGHYLQAMHANKFKSDVRAVFSSGPFVEGWAVYAEWLMAKEGFGGPRVKLQRLKMVLRLCANAILDHGVHAGTMDEKEALALMMAEAFQEEGEAVGKWRRARLTSAQLTTYFYGFIDLLRLRQSLEKQPGFTERAYHDRLLASGAPSIRHVRTLMAPQQAVTTGAVGVPPLALDPVRE